MGKTRGFWSHKQRGIDITRLLARDGNACHLCGDILNRRLRDPKHPRYVTFDHVIPRSAGGETKLSNLRLAHSRCNSLRGSDPLVEDDETSITG